MQTRVLLILLLCGVCFSCHSPQQDKQESDLTKVNISVPLKWDTNDCDY